jgi:putative ubiquitin-RnfH superfamily antitoxin RatB of RatAB toxin-antitoxin module
MRKQLAKEVEVRATFTGVFVRFGTKNGWRGPEKTVLLNEIKNAENKIVSDHLWFNMTKSFEKLNLQENDIVQFDARVKEYEKGYKGYRIDVYKPIEVDYKLSHPTKIKIISEAQNETNKATENPEN